MVKPKQITDKKSKKSTSKPSGKKEDDLRELAAWLLDTQAQQESEREIKTTSKVEKRARPAKKETSSKKVKKEAQKKDGDFFIPLETDENTKNLENEKALALSVLERTAQFMSTLQKTKVPAKQRAATTHTKGKHTDTAHLDLFHQYRSAARGEESKKEIPRAKAPPPHRLTITSDADTDSEASSEPSWEEESDDEAFFAKLKKKKISDVTDSENESEEEESSEEEEKPSKKVRKGTLFSADEDMWED